MLKLLSEKRIQLIVIILLTFLAYSNIFGNKLITDDRDFIVSWKSKQSFKNIGQILKGAGPESRENAVYRPVRGVFYMVYYKLWGTGTFGYQMHAILVQILVTVLVYLVLEKLTGKRQMAFFGGLVFGLHPVHTDAITFLTSSMDMTAFVFFFASLYFYLHSYDNKAKKNLRIISLIFATLAFFTNEITLVLPILIVICDYFLGRVSLKAIVKNVVVYLPYFVLALVYLGLRTWALSAAPIQNSFFENGKFNYIQLLIPKVFVKYIWLLIWPVNLSINHIIPPGLDTFSNIMYKSTNFVRQDFFDRQLYFAIFILVVLFSLMIWLWRKQKILALAMSWFLVSLLPVANLFGQPTIMSERYTYLASFGYCLIVGYLISRIFNFPFRLETRSKRAFSIFNKKFIQILVVIFTIFVIGGYGVRTYLRNFDWRDEITLWQKAAKIYPKSALAYYNLASLYDDQSNFNQAAVYFEKTIEIMPSFYNSYFNLAAAYKKIDKRDLAKQQYLRVIKVNPTIMDAYFYLADDYIKENQADLAFEALKEATAHESNYLNSSDPVIRGVVSDIYDNLGVLYQKKGDNDQALASYKKALEVNPNNKKAKENLEKLSNPSVFSNNLIKKEAILRFVSRFGFVFEHPVGWQAQDGLEKVFLKSRNGRYTFEISMDVRGANVSIDNYLSQQGPQFGDLVKNGFISLPNVDKAFARLWESNGVKKAEFFIFKAERVFKILIYPSTDETQAVFDQIVATLQITNE